MKRNYLIPAIFVCIYGHSFSQTTANNSLDPPKDLRDTIAAYSTDILIDRSTHILQKTPLPANQKVSPTVFYIKNDKPVEQQASVQQAQETSAKK
jgi:hypothetical protein